MPDLSINRERVVAELSRETPFEQKVDLRALVQAGRASEIHSVLVEVLSNLELMVTRPCGYRHEIFTSGEVGSVCSEAVRALQVYCYHGARAPMRGAINDLAKLGFISEESRIFLTSGLHGGLKVGDDLAGLLYAYLDSKDRPDETKFVPSKAQLEPTGFSGDLNSLTFESAHRVLVETQVKAAPALPIVLLGLKRGLAAAVACDPDLQQMTAAFRTVFLPVMDRVRAVNPPP